MLEWTQFPLLADLDWIGPVIFLTIMFVSWIARVIKGTDEANQRPQARPQGRDERLRSEIDSFLKEVAGAKKEPNPAAEVVEIVDFEEEPAKPRRLQPQPRKQPAARSKAAAKRQEKPGERLSKRQGPRKKELGSGIDEYVSEHIQEGRISSRADREERSDVSDSVAEHLGIFTAAGEARRKAPRTKTAAAIVAMLRNQQNVKQAIIISEVLNRPRSRRQ